MPADSMLRRAAASRAQQHTNSTALTEKNRTAETESPQAACDRVRATADGTAPLAPTLPMLLLPSHALSGYNL